MKVVLLADVRGQGKKDQVIDVSEGYARNFLFPKKLAMVADNKVMNEIKGKEEKRLRQIELEKAAALATKAKLESGELHVFDTATFTVGGETLTSYLADVDTDANYEKETEVIADGYFHESEKRSAPYFDVDIDGITKLNAAY